MSWTVAKLGEVCKIVSGSTPSRVKPELWDGGVFWITPKDLDESRILELYESPETISDKGLASCSTQILPVDSVLFSSRAPIGLVAINKVPLCTNQGFKSLVPGEKIHYKYLAYWLKAHKLQLQAMGNGATFKELSKSIFEKVEIPLPPLPVQKKIAAVLEKADELRRKREEQIKRLDDLLQATFLDMFGDPVTNPKGWKSRVLGDCVEETIKAGAYFKKEIYCDAEGLPMIHMTDAFGEFVDYKNAKRVNVSVSGVKEYLLTSRDLLVARRSLNLEGAAKVSMIPDVDEPLIFESSLIRITPKPEAVNHVFLYFYLNNQGVKETFVRPYITVATISGINQTNLKKIKILLPESQLQRAFEKIFYGVKIEQRRLRDQQDIMSDLFNSLMQRAFKGELDLV